MSSIEQARKALGQLFIIGFDGLDLSDETSSFLSQANIGGVILFAPNYESPGQIAELINAVQECRAEMPFWASVDHEGGRVQRFKKPFTRIPDAATIGASDSPKLAFELAEMMARELKAVGINVNFCPVVDIATNPKNPAIGNRAYAATEDQVSKMISAMVRGHCTQGVQPCVKHFPGHGDTVADSHLTLPRVETPLETLENREFRPFVKAFKSRCAMVMTAHILNPTIDPEFPATLSPKTIRDILRKNLRYTRVVVTDDMEMKAITDNYGAEDAPRLALQAGCDILVYRSEAAARHAYESLVKALEGGKLAPEIIFEAEARVRALKKDSIQPYHPVAIAELGQKIGTEESQALIQRIEDAAKGAKSA
jgi:beta-N-acetylhexosaminidase